MPDEEFEELPPEFEPELEDEAVFDTFVLVAADDIAFFVLAVPADALVVPDLP